MGFPKAFRPRRRSRSTSFRSFGSNRWQQYTRTLRCALPSPSQSAERCMSPADLFSDLSQLLPVDDSPAERRHSVNPSFLRSPAQPEARCPPSLAGTVAFFVLLHRLSLHRLSAADWGRSRGYRAQASRPRDASAWRTSRAPGRSGAPLPRANKCQPCSADMPTRSGKGGASSFASSALTCRPFSQPQPILA